ncbi:hypothetical protein AGMMS50293_21630 [Spirochaetia bacterium]|nr:hypothetical protein AGMMS50293_21630 [Spirochaetia bacterium]
MSELKENTVQEPQMFLAYPGKELEPKYFTTVKHIETIIEYTEALGTDDLLFEKAASLSHTGIVAERLGITTMQAVIFSLMFSQYNTLINNAELATLFNCTPIKLLDHMNDLEALEAKKLIESKRNVHAERHRNAPRRGAPKDPPSFFVPWEVVNTLRKKDAFVPESRNNIGLDEFFEIVDEFFCQLIDDEITLPCLTREIDSLIENNMHLLFCQKLKSYNFSQDDMILLLCFCHLYVNNHDDIIGFHDFEFLYDKKFRSRQVFRSFRLGDHVLMESKFIENTNNDGFLNRELFKLSDKAKKDLLSELDLKDVKIFRKKGLLLWDSMGEKKLFYNEKEARGIEELGSLLMEENFKNIRERLDQSGMRQGFACLFSGGPGTGKTETVYQIARAAKRNIMAVDISAIKGMYVGETEKQAKAIFDNYRKAVATSDIAPILLFNEADAIIGKRIEFTDSSRSVDRMENTMQNIILQELETLDGILIATTNLTKNMDHAFERRFLYKIEFEKPGIAARESIWKAMLPTLAEDDITALASRFEISGGQIENAVRKYTVQQVLHGIQPSLEAISAYCREELRGADEGKTIGFAIGRSK